jgi:hypothetical protein
MTATCIDQRQSKKPLQKRSRPQMTAPFRYFRTSPEITRLAVMMYIRFPISLRNVKDLLQERGWLSLRRGARVRVNCQLFTWLRWGGCRSPLTASQCAKLAVLKHQLKERASMEEVTIIGVDLAKNVFQLHGAAGDGSVVFRKKLSRPQFARFMAQPPPCLVAMEACASAHRSSWISVAFAPVGAQTLRLRNKINVLLTREGSTVDFHPELSRVGA